MLSRFRKIRAQRLQGPAAHACAALSIAVAAALAVYESWLFGSGVTFLFFVPAAIIVALLETRVVSLTTAAAMAAFGIWLSNNAAPEAAFDTLTRAALFLLGAVPMIIAFDRQRKAHAGLRRAVGLAEERLQTLLESEARYREAFAGAALGFATVDSEGRLCQVNRRFSELTGFAAGELEGRRIDDLFVAGDRLLLTQTLSELSGTKAVSATVEARVLRADHDPFWSRLTLSAPQTDQNLPWRVFVIVEDITERRRIREALQAEKEWLDLALSAGRLGIWRVDLTSGMVMGSEKFWEMLGLAETGEVILDRIADVVHPDDWSKFAAAGEPETDANFDAEIRVDNKHKHNYVRWLALRGRQEVQNGRAVRLGVAADVTDRRAAILFRANARKQEIVTRELRHRLDNMFPVVIALAKMVDAEGSDVDSFRTALIDRLRALELTNRLLSRRVNGGSTVKDLVLQELKPYQDTRRIRVEGIPVNVAPGTAQSFAMIIHELATNSVKHGALGQPAGRLDVSWRIAEQPADDGDIKFEWLETGLTIQPPRKGQSFGSNIIGAEGEPLVGHSASLELGDGKMKYSLCLPRGSTGSSAH